MVKRNIQKEVNEIINNLDENIIISKMPDLEIFNGTIYLKKYKGCHLFIRTPYVCSGLVDKSFIGKLKLLFTQPKYKCRRSLRDIILHICVTKELLGGQYYDFSRILIHNEIDINLIVEKTIEKLKKGMMETINGEK